MTRPLPSPKGWCPGALRPMESGDGLIVRVRPRQAALSTAQLHGLASAALRYGNGLIDLTRRANIQLRGVKAETLGELQSALHHLDLLDPNAETETVRNVMLNPLAGIDPSEATDLHAMAQALEQRLIDDKSLWALPAKFGFIVDGAGLLGLGNERADIRLTAVGKSLVAIGIDRRDGPLWIGSVEHAQAVNVAIEVALAFVALKTDATPRIRDFTPEAITKIQRRVEASGLAHAHHMPTNPSRPRVGMISLNGNIIAAGCAAPFGRLDAGMLSDVANAAEAHHIDGVRISPWRVLYVPTPGIAVAAGILTRAAASGFITNPDDPLLRVDACPGAPACSSAAVNTRAAARVLAPLLSQMACRSLHVSGCAKGCARSTPADLVLVGDGDCFAVVRHDTAQGYPGGYVAAADIPRLPHILHTFRDPHDGPTTRLRS